MSNPHSKPARPEFKGTFWKAALPRLPGCSLIPLNRPGTKSDRGKPIGKAPRDRNWTVRKYSAPKVVATCNEDSRNMGLRLSPRVLVMDIDPRNGGLKGWSALCHDFELDEDAFPRFITGGGGFHCFAGLPEGVKVRDTLEDYPGVEFKSAGRQIVVPGSIHPDTRKPYAVSKEHPRIADGLPKLPTLLREAITRPNVESGGEGGELTPAQVADMLAALDATKFGDNASWLQLMMAVHHASNGDARQEWLEWSATDPAYEGDSDWVGRRWDSLHTGKAGGVTVATLYKALRDNGAAEKIPVREIGDDFDDLDFDSPDDDAPDLDFDTPAEKEPRKSKRYTETKLPALLDFAEKCMIEEGAQLYQMGGRMVHPVRVDKDSDAEAIRRKAGSLTIGEVNQHRLREYMIDAVPFHKTDKKGKPFAFPAPMNLAAHYLARGDKWRLPVINGVIETPTLRRDGCIIETDGFDPKSGLLLDMGGVEYPPIKGKPTKADALAALELLKEPFAGFPFVANAKGQSASRSVMLSAVLTALVRRTLHSAPMHGTSAPTMGTGKTLAIDVVSLIATGRLTTAMSQGANEEEDEKRLFSVLLQNDLILLIDNVKRAIEGDALCTVLTQSSWQSRILGESRKVEVPTNVLMMASGNNLTFKGDMTTRALLCRLDARIENPETRRFDVDLKSWVPANRVALVVAGLELLRAFVVAGRPGLDKLTPFGRFEDWSNLVRGALVWLGEPDPCKTRQFIAIDDPERGDLGQLFTAIADNIGDEAFTAATLIKTGDDCSDGLLTDAIANALPKATVKTFGQYLHARNGKIIGGLRLIGKYDSHRKINTYRIKPTE